MPNKKTFWDQQAKLGKQSGSQDITLDQLEQEILLKNIQNPKKILEIGCGDGRNTLKISKKYPKAVIHAFDFSSEMISAAKENKSSVSHKIEFFVHDMEKLNLISESYDLIISKRALINLNSYDKQVEVINNIYNLLQNEGTFLMCESSKKGLKKINELRAIFDLQEIKEPWHNNYIDEEKLDSELLRLDLIEKIYFSSTYYFLSRIVNAHLANLNNKLPEYNSPINKMALSLPYYGETSQSVLWNWKKIIK